METIPHKACRRCGGMFPETPDFFYRNANCKNGLSPWCKGCMRTYHQEWDNSHRPNRDRPDRRRVGVIPRDLKKTRTEKRCPLCQTVKPLAEFVPDARRADGHEHRCKTCYKLYRRRNHSRAQESPGYIYLIRSAGRYKIGLSVSPQTRMIAIQSPFPVELVCVIPTENMLLLENQLHEQFNRARKHGEWFELSDADVEQIKHMAG